MRKLRFFNALSSVSFQEINGFYKVQSVPIARIGTQPYLRDGRLLVELRPVESVRDSVKHFIGLPVLLGHPPDNQLVNPETAKEFTIGAITEAEYNETTGWIVADLVVWDKYAVQEIRNGQNQLSAGYDTMFTEVSGEWVDELGVQGEVGKVYAYDRIQSTILPNHLSFVSQARAGNLTAVTLDSNDELVFGSNLEKETMDFVTLDYLGKEIKVAKDSEEEVLAMIESLIEQSESMDKQKVTCDSLESELAKVKTELSTTIGKYDALVSQQANTVSLDSDEIKTEVAERLAAWRLVGFDNTEITFDAALPALEVKRAYLTSKVPELAEKVKNGDASYIDGMLSVLETTVSHDGVKVSEPGVDSMYTGKRPLRNQNSLLGATFEGLNTPVNHMIGFPPRTKTTKNDRNSNALV